MLLWVCVFLFLFFKDCVCFSFYFFYSFKLIYFWLCWLFSALHGHSLVEVIKGYTCVCGFLLLGSWASVAAACRLSSWNSQFLEHQLRSGGLPGSSPSRIQGYRQDDSIGGRIAKQREQRLDLPWLTQKTNKAPVFQGVILKEQREKKKEKEKKNYTGRPSFGEWGPQLYFQKELLYLDLYIEGKERCKVIQSAQTLHLFCLYQNQDFFCIPFP